MAEMTYEQRYYAENKERIKARNHERYWADPEKARAAKRADYEKHRAERNAKAAEYYRENRETIIAQQTARGRTEPYRERKRIYSKVQNAKRRGALVPEACEDCGATERLDAHHEDYSRPLDVTILCRPCHGLRHAKGGG